MKHPDPKKHMLISFTKSAIRIIGCIGGIGFALSSALVPAVCVLSGSMLVAEIVGIWEELV